MTSKRFCASRRRLLVAGTAAGAAVGLFPGVSFAQQTLSPLQRGPHPVGRALLGVTPGTQRLPLPAMIDLSTRGENTVQCKNGPLSARRPAEIAAQLWYPAKEESRDFSRELAIARPAPLILYAHAKRRWLTCPEHIPEPLPSAFSDYSLDFQRTDRMLSHLASHGFVVAAPDLGWLAETFELGDWEGVGGLPRARILKEVFDYLKPRPGIDTRRIGLVGHSTGGAAVLALQEQLPATRFIGLIAPGGEETILKKAAQSPATLVIVSTLDLQLVRDPVLVYRDARDPKVLVRIDGANHLGFTDLCSEDNKVCIDGDPPGLIDRNRQQDLAAGYLAAMATRYLIQP
jgi:predicted dienelactone hydrolase